MDSGNGVGADDKSPLNAPEQNSANPGAALNAPKQNPANPGSAT
jgi:hypothetical protein